MGRGTAPVAARVYTHVSLCGGSALMRPARAAGLPDYDRTPVCRIMSRKPLGLGSQKAI